MIVSDIFLVVGIPVGGILENGNPARRSIPIDGFLVADVRMKFLLAVQMVAHLALQHKRMLSPEKAWRRTASI